MAAQEGQDYNITVLSSLGQQIAVLHNGALNNGLNTFEYNTTDLARGIYIIKIESEGRFQTVKLIKQ
jgi:hypothetical protein